MKIYNNSTPTRYGGRFFMVATISEANACGISIFRANFLWFIEPVRFGERYCFVRYKLYRFYLIFFLFCKKLYKIFLIFLNVIIYIKLSINMNFRTMSSSFTQINTIILNITTATKAYQWKLPKTQPFKFKINNLKNVSSIFTKKIANTNLPPVFTRT